MSTQSQEATIYNTQRVCIGYVSENGFVYDRQRQILGFVNRQGVIRCYVPLALQVMGVFMTTGE